jgi:hypothetical protein
MFDKKYGVLNGAGADEHYEVREEPLSTQGVTFIVNCDNCGTEQRVTIGWQQIVDAAALPTTRRLPVDPETRVQWAYDNGRVYPQLGCLRCRSPMYLGITPDEASRKIMAGQAAGLVRINR